MPKIAVYPGSFDPITFGHLDIAARAAGLFDELHIVVVHNPAKTPYFSSEERVALIESSFSEAARFGKAFPSSKQAKVIVSTMDSGLLVDYCKSNEIQSIVKGLRAVTDFDYELQMAQVNLQASGVETMFMATAPAHSFLSSSLVKELAHYGGDVSSMVPMIVNEALKSRVAEGGK